MVYKNNSGSWSLIGQVAPGQLYFRGNSTTELISISNSVQVYDIGSTPSGNGFFQPVRTLNYANLSGGDPIVTIGYDPPSQKIYVETVDQAYYSTIKTYDAVNFSLQDAAKAYVPPAIPFATKHYYSNNYHFLSTGFGEQIK
jgi:hypothetical protein